VGFFCVVGCGVGGCGWGVLGGFFSWSTLELEKIKAIGVKPGAGGQATAASCKKRWISGQLPDLIQSGLWPGRGEGQTRGADRWDSEKRESVGGRAQPVAKTMTKKGYWPCAFHQRHRTGEKDIWGEHEGS